MKDLAQHEVTCVVQYNPHDPALSPVSCSAVHLSPSYVLAPGCLLGYSKGKLRIELDGEFMVQSAAKATHRELIELKADFVTSWCCKELSKVINTLFSSSDISTSRSSDESTSIEFDTASLSTFVLLQIDDPSVGKEQTLQKYSHIPTPSSPEEIIVCSTPFGSSHLTSFYNSWSAGIISKCVDQHSGVFMTDVSCVPGSQGGLVYMRKSMSPAAIILHPVIWKADECTGLSLIASLNGIVKSLREHLNMEGMILTPNIMEEHYENAIYEPQHENFISERLVRVRIGGTWGSGILISGQYVLTCAHVVQGHKNRKINVMKKDQSLSCKVIYESIAIDKLDVAILELEHTVSHIPILQVPSSAKVGLPVLCSGYGIFENGTYCINTAGIVASIMRYQSCDHWLVTTCKVNSGSSGGIVTDTVGQPIGMIMANTYDETNQMTYSNVSIVLSLHILYDSLIEMCTENSVKGFINLERLLCTDKGFSLQAKL